MRILILTQRGSFEILGQQIKRLVVHDGWECEVLDWQKANAGSWDVVIALWWHAAYRGVLERVHANRCTVGAVFDLVSWTIGVAQSEGLRETLKKFDLLVVGNIQILSELRARYGSLPPAFVCETGADLRFPVAPFPQVFSALWAGNSHATSQEMDLKGLRIVREACDISGTPLLVADSAGEAGPRVPHDEMPGWYRQGSVYLVGSQSEGTPRTMLEALSCGRPVVTTRVGLASRLVHHGINGCVVDRTPQAMAEGIRYVRSMVGAHANRVQTSCRNAAEAWGDEASGRKWQEVIMTAAEGKWWRDAVIPQPGQPVPRPPVRKRVVQGDLEVMELKQHPIAAETLQGLVNEAERQQGVTSVRPVIRIASLHRFASRTMYIIEHLVSRFRFEVGVGPGDAVWSFYPFRDGEAAAASGLPFLLSMRGQFWHMSNDVIAKAVKVYDRATYITTLTVLLYQELTKQWPQLTRIQHSVVRNGHFIRNLIPSSTAIPTSQHKRPIVLCVTNFLFDGKRRAVAELARALDSARFNGSFLVAAQEPRKNQIPNLGRCGVYLGHVDDRFALYRTADVFLYHSYIDGQPTALIEAMSAGLPCVVGRAPHSGATEFVDHETTGLIFNHPDQGAAMAMRLLVRPSVARELGAAGRKWVSDNCRWDLSAKAYGAILDGLIGAKESTP